MDFELNRYYDSNEANLGHATVEYIKKLEVDTVWVNYKAADGAKCLIPHLIDTQNEWYCSNIAKSGMNSKTLQYLMGA